MAMKAARFLSQRGTSDQCHHCLLDTVLPAECLRVTSFAARP